jgi:hypothetical protein
MLSFLGARKRSGTTNPDGGSGGSHIVRKEARSASIGSGPCTRYSSPSHSQARSTRLLIPPLSFYPSALAQSFVKHVCTTAKSKGPYHVRLPPLSI